MDTSYPLWIKKLPGIPREKMARAALFPYKDIGQLERSLEAGPQFRRLNWRDMLACRTEQLRIILFARQDYYAAQAAAHITALERLMRPRPESEYGAEKNAPQDLSRHLTLLDASLLLPSEEISLRLSELDTPAVLIRGDALGAMRDAVLEQIEDTTPLSTTRPLHIFIHLHPEQIDKPLLADLQLQYGFQVGVVDEPDLPYLARQLRQLTHELLPVRKNIDWETLVRRVQDIRGEQFIETDLACIPALAMMNGASIPAAQEDLDPKLFDVSCLQHS